MRKRFSRPRDPTLQANHAVKVYIPISLYTALKARSDKSGMPVSRLVCYAIDNELTNNPDPFSYPCPEPTNTFVEAAYTEEGGKIFRFLKKFGPHGVDQLMMARRELGILDKLTFMLGLREILMRNTLVRKVYPSWTKYKYPPNYTVVATVESSDEKRIEKMKRLQQELDQLKGYDNGIHGLPETSDSEEA